MSKLNYSYVMGMTDNIYSLEDSGFNIEKINTDYMITFSNDKSKLWEEFIEKNLKEGFWNEYIGENIVFIFRFSNGQIKKYVLDENNEFEILALCNEFAEASFQSIKEMLLGNSFYRDML